ncbi:hypothetical protein DE146DRAFT_630501 [Phaeosphaeria sp. MPI-PUGE-AT-0046c]|nr:hypothetical protein DE146DRAFT_630501 [Phaeosphaeria sp. MPI-PUGE-AT-0046c]
MKTFTTLLLLVPALVLASPAPAEDIVLPEAGLGLGNLDKLEQVVSIFNELLASAKAECAVAKVQSVPAKLQPTPAVLPNNSGQCCSMTSCFIGCPVGGMFRLCC